MIVLIKFKLCLVKGNTLLNLLNLINNKLKTNDTALAKRYWKEEFTTDGFQVVEVLSLTRLVVFVDITRITIEVI